MTDTDIPIFRDRLLDELTEIIEQRAANAAATAAAPSTTVAPRRRYLVYKAAAVAAVAIGVFVAVEARRDGPADASFTLSQGADGVITIRFDDGFDDGVALQNELRDAGVDIDITVVPASPSLVGRVLSVHGTSDTFPQPGIKDIDGGVTIDPSTIDGELAMMIGVAAEHYQTAASAFEPREALDGLQCALPEPLTAHDVIPYLDERGIEAEWTVLTPVPNPDWEDEPRDPDAEAVAPQWFRDAEDVTTPPNGLILYANSASTELIRFEIVAEGIDPPPAPGWQPDFDVASCTPERAAYWE